jgi:hypothetical protein
MSTTGTVVSIVPTGMGTLYVQLKEAISANIGIKIEDSFTQSLLHLHT